MRLGPSIMLHSALAVSMASLAHAHGSLSVPVSRIYNGFLQGPESPPSPAVAAAIAIGGTQPFYDWNELVNFAPGQPPYQMDVPYSTFIPDGKLASGGNFKYRGLDLVRDDWPATSMTPGPFQFVWKASTPHEPSVFHAWITNADWHPLLPLTWGAMEELPIGSVTLAGGEYRFSSIIPPRTGKHCIYVIWQRIDPVGEGFYAIADVNFDGAISPCPADLNGDLSIDGADLGAMLGAWNTAGADLNGDGTTDGADLGELLGSWGACGADCDGDGVPDALEIAGGAADCDANQIPDSCEMANGGDSDGNGILDACQLDGLTYQWSVANQWSGGFIGQLTVTNGSPHMLHEWQLQFGTPGYSIVNLWDGQLQSQSNGQAIVNNATWNGHVHPGESFTIGFEGSGVPSAPPFVLLDGNVVVPAP
jgi:chitin-binding protein